MMKKDNRPRDAFTYSLGGLRAVASFNLMPVIAHDRLRQDLTERPAVDPERKRFLWMPRRSRVV